MWRAICHTKERTHTQAFDQESCFWSPFSLNLSAKYSITPLVEEIKMGRFEPVDQYSYICPFKRGRPRVLTMYVLEHLCSISILPQMTRWSHSPDAMVLGIGTLGGDYIVETEPPWMGLAPLYKRHGSTHALLSVKRGDSFWWTRKLVLTRHQCTGSLSFGLHTCEK